MKNSVFMLLGIVAICLFSCSKKSTEVLDGTVETPYFSLIYDIYFPPQTLSITCGTVDAEIRYTLDGTIPTKKSNLYSVPLELDSTVTVKAVAFKEGLYPSAVASKHYIMYIPTAEDARIITSMTALPDSVYADDGLTRSEISVTVKNLNDDPVPNQQVLFRTNLGNVLSCISTDSTGVAKTTFWAHQETGIANITAVVKYYHPDYSDFLISADTAYVKIKVNALPESPAEVNSIRFVNTENIYLSVANTSMVDSWQLRVKLFDQHGNIVTEPHQVWFRILNPQSPNGATLNNFPSQDSVLAVSNNGIAQITLYAGTIVESPIIKASCTDCGHYRETVRGNIYIHSGPAYRMEIFAGGFNSGENMGNGYWRILAGVHAYDIYNNIVEYGVSIWFDIPDNEYNCQIYSNCYVGNESVYGDSTAGTAYTAIIYHGLWSGAKITVRARTAGIYGNEIIAEKEITLPINQPCISLEIIPAYLVFHGNSNHSPTSATAVINVYLSDSQGCPLSYCYLVLSSEYGHFEYTTGTNTDPEHYNPQSTPWIIVTSTGGTAQGLIRFYAEDIPYDDPTDNQPTALTSHLTATLQGTDVSVSWTIILLRYA